ncbi:protein kinase [Myxococcota bacterium]|nr:protein kinase [Myxococcota bacterium]
MLMDRYELQERLGAGGMAKVFRAFDHALSRPVAVKTLHDDLATNEEIKLRFLREARVFARLRHPHIIEIHDVVQGEKSAAMVMELIDGTDLAHLTRRQPLRIPELALCLLRPVLDALAHAHAEGVIHRDVKPANILLSRDGRVKLGDFGIAKVLEETHLTQTGEFLGTPAYIAPEQARGEPVTAAVDQYAAGVVLYELLAGRPPYVGPTPLAVLSQILIGKFPEIRTLNPVVDEALAAVVHRALAPEPADRFADLPALIAALDALAPPLSSSRERQIVAGLLADPAATVESVARAAADEQMTTARRALAAGDVAAARAAAQAALLRAPEHAEAKEVLDTLRHSVGELVALEPRTPTAETDVFVKTPPPRSRLPLGLGAAAAALLCAGLLMTVFRDPPAADPGPVTAVATPGALLAARQAGPSAPGSSAPAPESRASASASPATEPPAPSSVTSAPRAPADRPSPAPRTTAPPTVPARLDEVPAAPASATPPVSAEPPAPGHLRLVTQPWAEVEVDGVPRGRTPYLKELELSPGRHRIVLRNPGFPPREELVEIGPAQTLVRRINLAGGAPE